MNKKKFYGTLIAVILFAIVIIGATFAWFTYSFNATNGVYNTATTCFDIDISEGQDINTTLDYVTNPSQGTSTSISLGINNSCNINAEGIIYLNVLNTTSKAFYNVVDPHCENPDTLETLYDYDNIEDCNAHSGGWVTGGTALKYAIYTTNNPNSNTIPIAADYIKGSGDTEIYNATLQKGSQTTYYIYFWVDGELIDNRYTEGLPFSGYIHTTANQVFSSNVNAPDVVDGLIPVKLSKTGNTVTTVAENDPSWYNYNEKKWANAILVNENTHARSYYLSNPGTTVPEEDILAYYVWIPRYSYKVWRLGGESSNTENHSIEIKFIPTNVIDEVPTETGKYYTHPAFWWDDDSDGVREAGEELAGIWVGKFELWHTTITGSLGCSYSACDSTKYNNLRILPNVIALRNNSESSFFFASRAMETSSNAFGINPSDADTHMIKNSEWGAAAYLSRSRYGINGEVRINNQNSYITGCGGTIDNAPLNSKCDMKYGTSTTYPQSTTGNVTGVFGMSGGVIEFVMGIYNNINNYGNSYSFVANTNPLPPTKYYDNYTITALSNCTLANCGGHALNETKGWYSDDATLFNTSNPFLIRGGHYYSGTTAGAFAISRHNGSQNAIFGTRLTLIKNIEE